MATTHNEFKNGLKYVFLVFLCSMWDSTRKLNNSLSVVITKQCNVVFDWEITWKRLWNSCLINLE